MNDPMFVEISESLGKRMEDCKGNTSEKLTAGFRWLMTRVPKDDELKMLVDFHDKHNDWTAIARVLLCLDEAVSKN